MFERFLAVPLHFTIEFLGFLIVAGGAFLVLSRPALIPGTRSNRIAAALGFGALAAAQIVHGGSFEKTDTGDLLLALKALGMALILIGVVGAVRASAGVVLAQSPGAGTDLVSFAPALASVAVAIMAMAASARGSRELRRLALGALLLGVAEAIMPFADQGGGARLRDGYELASHLIRTAGYFALASWLWTGVRSSIRTRYVASFVTLLVVVVLALSSALTGVISNNVEDSELDRVSGQVLNAQELLTRASLQSIARQTRAEAGDLDLQAAILENAVPVAARESVASDRYDADALIVTNPGGKTLGVAGTAGYVTAARAAKLTKEDLFAIIGSAPAQAVITDPRTDSAGDLAQIGDSVALVGVAEVINPVAAGDVVIGVVILVDFLDQLTVQDLKSNFGTGVSLVVGKRVAASTLHRDLSGADLVPRDMREELEFAADGVVARAQTLEGDTFYGAAAQLRSEDGFGVGYLVLSSPSRIVAQARDVVTRTLFLVALGVAGVVLVLAYYSGRRITRPIQALTETAQKIREGDLKAQAEVSGQDEVGQLGETFNEMTTSLFRMTNDLRSAAREEHELRSRIETIIQSMADGLIAVNADGEVLAFNREAEQLTGTKAKSAMGKQIEKVLDVRDAQGDKAILPIFDLAEGSVGGIFVHNKSGDRIPVSVVSAALRDEEGETAGGVAVLRDMTREREVEKMKSEFLSNISHELRTPLTPIKGYAEILDRKEVPPAKVKQFTRGILESTARLERIVELLVDFAALEAGRLSPRTAAVDLVGIVEKLAQEWEQRTPRHSVVADIGTRLPKVLGDERLLRRSFEELLDNAVKFSPDGGTITLEVRGATRRNGDERRRKLRAVEVTVVDQGIGIPHEDLGKIFSDFHQLDGSETRSYGGLGLGLSFVRRIVEAHDGTVSVESEPEQGTRLTVSIPAAKGRGSPSN